MLSLPYRALLLFASVWMTGEAEVRAWISHGVPSDFLMLRVHSAAFVSAQMATDAIGVESTRRRT